MQDQATALRQIVQSRYEGALGASGGGQVVAVASGKGGVGKTNLSVNLAIALRRNGQRVAILDADFGLANVDVFLGLTAPYHLGHVLEGIVPMESILVEGPEQIDVIPASSGLQELAQLDEFRRMQILAELKGVLRNYDQVLIDTAAGISENVIGLLEFSHRVIVVSAPEPTAIVDAYALMKVLLIRERSKDLQVVINSVANEAEADEVYQQLSRVVKQFLGKKIDLLGYILEDEKVPRAVREQIPLLVNYPGSPAGRCLTRIAERLLENPVPTEMSRPS